MRLPAFAPKIENDPPQHESPEQALIIKDIERGRRLREVIGQDGWKDVLDIMEEEVAQAEYHLMNYNGSDREIVLALQRRARDKREFFQKVQTRIFDTLHSADEHLAALKPEPPGLAEGEVNAPINY